MPIYFIDRSRVGVIHMEVNSFNRPSTHDIAIQAKAERSHVQNRQSVDAQGSVDTSSRKAEHESRVEGKEWSLEDLQQSIESMNELVMFKPTSLKFEQHETLNRTMVKIIDKQTDEIVREIPPEEFLDMISSMLEFAGIIIDEKI